MSDLKPSIEEQKLQHVIAALRDLLDAGHPDDGSLLRMLEDELARCSAARHGKRYTYIRGCRCELCTAANRNYSKGLQGKPAPSHGVSGYVNYGCRCEVCTSAARVDHLERGQRRLASGQIEHGTSSAAWYGCKCDECQRYRRVYEAEHRPSGPVPHGTKAGYKSHRCRCDECRAAGSKENKARYERRKTRLRQSGEAA